VTRTKPAKTMTEPLRTPSEAVHFLGLDRQDLRQPREALRWLCRTGKLRFTKIGRYIRFRQAWLEELVDRNAVINSERACAPSAESSEQRSTQLEPPLR
jgi:hypothetical protein